MKRLRIRNPFARWLRVWKVKRALVAAIRARDHLEIHKLAHELAQIDPGSRSFWEVIEAGALIGYLEEE